MEPNNTTRAEAERLLGISEKLLHNKDLNGSRDFAILAQETEPLLDGPDQILAVTEVLIAADKRINNHHPDWYAILGIDKRRSDDIELIKKQYRRLAFLLHPDKNRYAFSDAAFKLVADAWAMLSDPTKKTPYDTQLGMMFSKVDLVKKPTSKNFQKQQNQSQDSRKLPVRRNSQEEGSGGGGPNFWTICPYCYNLYEYPKDYNNCCLRCQSCERAFTATNITSMPPIVPGKEAYYCGWGFFPMGFAVEGGGGSESGMVPMWMPPMFPYGAETLLEGGLGVGMQGESGEGFVNVGQRHVSSTVSGSRGGGSVNVARRKVSNTQLGATPRKRGRPRKNPLPQV